MFLSTTALSEAVTIGLGLEIRGNVSLAKMAFHNAAVMGDVEAQYHLGRLSLYFIWGENNNRPDISEGLAWLTTAGNNGHVIAQYLLGNHYSAHGCLGYHPKEAFKWFQKAADQGYDNAQYEVARHYLDGIGVKENKEKAFEYFTKAAEQGHDFAPIRLEQYFVEDPEWANISTEGKEVVQYVKPVASEFEEDLVFVAKEFEKRTHAFFDHLSAAFEELSLVAGAGREAHRVHITSPTPQSVRSAHQPGS